MNAARFDALTRRLGTLPFRRARATGPRAALKPPGGREHPDLQRRSPGDLIASEEITAPDDPSFPPGARAWRVRYVSTGRDNTVNTLVSGVIVAPADPARLAVHDDAGTPTGRVVAWTHGTLGIIQRCQPSENPAQEIWGPAPFGINQIAWGSEAHGDAHAGRPEDGMLAGMIDQGWIVAATDYASEVSGDGALQPFVIGKIEAANAIDCIRAAHALLAGLHDGYAAAAYDVVTWGHSQGGHAAMWTGQLLAEYVAATGRTGDPALALSGVVLEAPASNLVAPPGAEGSGLLDWTAHAALQLTGQPVAIPLAPFFFSYIFAAWARQSATGTPDPSAMPAFPATGALDLDAVVTSEALPTVAAMPGYCWADGEQVATLAAPYATTPFLTPALASGSVIGGRQRGNVDRICGPDGAPPPALAAWCAWIRANDPGPHGVHPFARLPARNGLPVPILITAGTNDGVVHCVAPDPTADAIPAATDCAPVALYDALRTEYCPSGGDTGHLTLLIWRQEAGMTTADHSDVTGLIGAASVDDLRFQGSPLETFMRGAFAGTLGHGCTAQVANGSARSRSGDGTIPS